MQLVFLAQDAGMDGPEGTMGSSQDIAGVIEDKHQGHSGRDCMIKLIRQSYKQLGVSKDSMEFTETCLQCLVGVADLRETPNRLWQHFSADYKRPIAEKYNFHEIIDNYNRWP